MEPNADFNYHETDAYKNQRYKGKKKELEKKIDIINFEVAIPVIRNTKSFLFFSKLISFSFCLPGFILSSPNR